MSDAFKQVADEKIKNYMWNKLLDKECRTFMHNLIRDEEGVVGEDEEMLTNFFSFIRASVVDYKVLVVLAMKWLGYDEKKQVNIAMNYAGAFYASHFMMLMDYLAHKFIKGELK